VHEEIDHLVFTPPPIGALQEGIKVAERAFEEFWPTQHTEERRRPVPGGQSGSHPSAIATTTPKGNRISNTHTGRPPTGWNQDDFTDPPDVDAGGWESTYNLLTVKFTNRDLLCFRFGHGVAHHLGLVTSQAGDFVHCLRGHGVIKSTLKDPTYRNLLTHHFRPKWASVPPTI